MIIASPIQLEVPPKDLVRLLLLEDQPESANSNKERFEAAGCTVDIAMTPEQAKENLLGGPAYQVIVTDVSLGHPGPDGDQFMLDNLDLMKEARKIVITGNGREMIRHSRKLKEEGIAVFEKGGADFLPGIKSEIGKALEARKRDIKSKLMPKVPAILDERLISFEIPIPSKDLLKILLIEDRPEVAGSLKERFESAGCTVDVAVGPEQAKLFLSETIYHIVVTDQDFPDSRLKGEQFILENPDLIRKARTVVITGNGPHAIHRQQELGARGTVVFEKGEASFLPGMRGVIGEALEERRREVSLLLKSTVSSILAASDLTNSFEIAEPNPGLLVLLQKLRELLMNWVSADGDGRDNMGIFYGGRQFSPTSLVEEIEKGTQIGIEHLDMFLNLVRHTLEV